MGAMEIAKDLYWVGVLDPDLRVFDVVMHTDYGTSYNSYLLKTEEGNILFETAKVKWFDRYMENIREVCELSSIKYIVIDHTEPDHTGSLEKLISLIPDVKVIASATAHRFLAEITNAPIPDLIVDHGDTISLGGLTLKFLSVPFLHWPDTIYTYIEEKNTLITCDSFGCHYADEKICNDLIDGDFTDAYRYYFNMIMGPFKSHVRYALDCIKDLDLKMICPGHGPVLRTDLQRYLDLYADWSEEPESTKGSKPLVVTAYASAYGYTEELAREVNRGILEEIDCEQEVHDMVYADGDAVLNRMKEADGILFGTSTINGDALPPVADLAGSLSGVTDSGKIAGAFGSYGWSGEGPQMINARLNLIRMETIEPPLRVLFKPSRENLEEAKTFGQRFGRRLKEKWEKAGTSADGRTFWRCTVCGEVFEGALPPATCPVCGVSADAFVEEIRDITTFKSEKKTKVVIIGSGAAGVAAAEAIRLRCPNASITMVSLDEQLPYYRPLLSKMISEEVEKDDLYIHHHHYYRDENITIKRGMGVKGISPAEKELTLADESTLQYDKLLLATGATPFIPPFKGRELSGVFSLRSYADMIQIKEALAGKEKARVTVIGGGLLGLEMACSFVRKGCTVTVIDTAPTLLPRQTDAGGSAVLKGLVEKSAVTVFTGAMVEQIYGTDQVQGIVLNSGEDIKADLVVVSAGLSPNISLAVDAGLTCDRAIVVNDRMQTSDPDIFAAGDCAIASGRYFGVWEPALAQGRVAGANIAGEEGTFVGRHYPATLNAFGTSLLAIGNLHNSPEPDQAKAVRSVDEMRGTCRTLYYENDKLDGALLIGDLAKIASIIDGVNRNIPWQESIERKLLS